jgi:hypothetical protein
MAFHPAAAHAVHHHSPLAVLSVLAVVGIIGYLISLRQHPRGRRCRTCKGTGTQKGLIFRYANRQCTRCGGSGNRGRIGLRVLRPGQVWGEKAPADAAAKRGENWGR